MFFAKAFYAPPEDPNKRPIDDSDSRRIDLLPNTHVLVREFTATDQTIMGTVLDKDGSLWDPGSPNSPGDPDRDRPVKRSLPGILLVINWLFVDILIIGPCLACLTIVG